MCQLLAEDRIIYILKLRHEHWAGLGLGFLIFLLGALGEVSFHVSGASDGERFGGRGRGRYAKLIRPRFILLHRDCLVRKCLAFDHFCVQTLVCGDVHYDKFAVTGVGRIWIVLSSKSSA
jgi:hypothetical protein